MGLYVCAYVSVGVCERVTLSRPRAEMPPRKSPAAPASPAPAAALIAPVPFHRSLLSRRKWHKRARLAKRLPVLPHRVLSGPCGSAKLTHRLLQLLPQADPLQVKRLRQLLQLQEDNPLHQRSRFHSWMCSFGSSAPPVAMVASALITVIELEMAH